LTVSFPLPTGSDFTFTLDPLCHAIDPETSSHEVLSTKLSLKLAKKERGIKWSALELAPNQATVPTSMATTSTTTKGIAYPTSSRSGSKNWDALEREAIKDAETWEKPDGDAAANKLFKDLFKNATPEVRRAMEKSYVESNGTALSTNWEEVSKGHMETKPPDSMVAKKWGS
jgi:suppressor of G2 allele of SKP1